MAVEIQLMADVKDLGAEGDIVRVAEGFARNFLIPRKLGAPVTEASKRRVAKIQKQREAVRKESVDKDRAVAAAIEKGSYTIPVKVGEGEKLFGSVTSADIIKVLQTQGFEVEKHAVTLDAPIRELGVYEVKVKLQPEVVAVIKVWIVQE
jgi:large subunit ribosomal protein L9